MTRHLAAHHEASSTGRVKRFLRIDHMTKGDSHWKALWQRPYERAKGNRRLVEYLRIARGEEV